MPYVTQFDPTAASHRHRTEQRLANENLSFVKAHFTQAPTCCPCIQNDNAYELMHGCTQHSASVFFCHCIEANEGCTTNYERMIRNSLSRMMKESRNVDNYGHFVSARMGLVMPVHLLLLRITMKFQISLLSY
jgi:hypothetical protein